MWSDLETIAEAYQRIQKGERPWTAWGDFLNCWHASVSQRAKLIEHPIASLEPLTREQECWAVFGAAMVDYLCERDHFPCPSWVNDPLYCLPEPWYTGLGANRPHIQERLQQEAPEPFVRRNVFCRAHAFSTKHEIAAKVQQRQFA